ncbi:hypothetical protein [Candidatus Protochlamydia phocaeensis]|uniref:hypothetical protein n=1 Tax=Candidatus Protochlamydia phocaeensis TaxID=1414722 RepID=UPI0008398B53|nr:hypothetical protein [Candidatus Protochlamydia phocaeensis]
MNENSPVSTQRMPIQHSMPMNNSQPAKNLKPLPSPPIASNENSTASSLKGRVVTPSSKVESGAETSSELSLTLSSSYKLSSKKAEDVKSSFSNLHIQLEKTPDHVPTRVKAVDASLSIASIASQKQVEDSYVVYAEECAKVVKKSNYFSPVPHYLDHLITRYKGVDCTNMNSIREALLQLKRGLEIDPSASKIQNAFDSTVEAIKNKWAQIRERGMIDENTYNLLLEQLESVLKEDPFKDEFRKNPALFTSAPREFLASHRHLSSIEEFIKKYPSEGNIRFLNNEYSMGNLRKALEEALPNPFARQLKLFSDEPFLTLSAANLIKIFMVAKLEKKQTVSVFFENEADGATLEIAFGQDIEKYGLKKANGHFEGSSKVVYEYFLQPSK